VVDSVTLSSIVISGQTLSDISTVQIKSYEVTYSRRQPGTRTPPRLVRGLGSVVSPNGTVAFTNLPLLGPEQLLSVPLADLLIENGSFDTETRGTIVTLDLQVSFFGEFLNGRAIRSEPIGFTLSLVP